MHDMDGIELKSRRHTAAHLGAAIELCYANGWTDGLPVVPPTAERDRRAAAIVPEVVKLLLEGQQR
jgi:hypothetical protein